MNPTAPTKKNRVPRGNPRQLATQAGGSRHYVMLRSLYRYVEGKPTKVHSAMPSGVDEDRRAHRGVFFSSSMSVCNEAGGSSVPPCRPTRHGWWNYARHRLESRPCRRRGGCYPTAGPAI